MQQEMPTLLIGDNKITSLAASLLPEITDKHQQLRRSRPRKSGVGDYVWRMVAFVISPMPIHHHMPMNAPFYLPGPAELGREEWQALQKGLDYVVDEIIELVAKTEWHGVARWSNLI